MPKPPLAVYRCPMKNCKGKVEMFVLPSPGYEPTCNGQKRHAATVMVKA